MPSEAVHAGGLYPGALEVEAERTSLVADGADSVAIMARLSSPGGAPVAVAGAAVVRFVATSGLLDRSAALLEDGVASVRLTADQAGALGRESERPITVRAVLEVDEATQVTGVVELVEVAPPDQPALFLTAEPAAIPADGESTSVLRLTSRALSDGTTVTFSASRGVLNEGEALLEDGAATVVLTAPEAPGPVTITASAEGMVDDEGPATVTTTLVVDAVPLDGPQFDLTGTWATLAIVRVKLSANTLTPNPQCAVAPSIQRVEVVQEGAAVTQRIKTCAVVLPPVETIVGEVSNETPPSFLASIPEVETVATLSSLELGARLDPPETLVVVGAELDDPAGDALPTEPDDPRVRDHDGDGEPGVTVLNSLAGDQHITYRNRGDQTGLVASSHRIDGSQLGDLVAITESSVLGFGNGFIPDTTSLPSVFQSLRVDGAGGSFNADADGDGTITCQEIVDAAPVVFDLEAPATPQGCGGL